MFTLCNVAPRHFFELVDGCVGPVTVMTSNGTAVDLRENELARSLLSDVAGEATLPYLSFSIQDPRDVSRVLRYMMEHERAC